MSKLSDFLIVNTAQSHSLSPVDLFQKEWKEVIQSHPLYSSPQMEEFQSTLNSFKETMERELRGYTLRNDAIVKELAAAKETIQRLSPSNSTTTSTTPPKPKEVVVTAKPPLPTFPLDLRNFPFPKDLSSDSFLTIQHVLNRVKAELENRGGGNDFDETDTYTFLKKKDGRMLNRDHQFLGGKIVDIFEFRSDKEKKIKAFSMLKSCPEPVVESTNNVYRLKFDANDDTIVIGIYRE